MAVPSPAAATLPVPANTNGGNAHGRPPSRPPLAGPSYSSRLGASPLAGLNGGGMSIDNRGALGKSYRPGSANPGSYGARFYGTGHDSPSYPFSSSVNMDSSSFVASSAAFGLPSGVSSSYRRSLSYAAAARGGKQDLSSSFAGMSFQPMSMEMGSYSKSQVHSLMANRPRTDAELTTAYECCGHTHSGLHALLEHVEDAHPFDDFDGAGKQIGFSPQVLAMDLELEQPEAPALGTIEERGSAGGSQRSSMSPTTAPGLPSYPVPTSTSSSKPATPSESSTPAPLQISDILTSPFTESLLGSSRPPTGPGTATASATSQSSSPADGTIATPSTSAQPSPVFAIPKVNPARGFLGTVPRPPPGRFDRAFNEVVAGSAQDKPTAVAPGMLFANAVAGLGIPTQPPVPGQKADAAEESSEPQQAQGAAEPALPQPSLFTTHKPWRCPNPGCNKAYKQSNGLKYHQQKGQCDFAIHDAVDLGLSIEEAEERSRPFVCAVGAGCTKRYRQMNGLKYHYLNSGEHGKYGLRMLQNGTHPQPSGVPSITKKPAPGGMSSPRPAGAPYTIPSQLGQTRPGGHNASGQGAQGGHPPPRMGVFPPTPVRPQNGMGNRTIPGAAPGTTAARPINGFRPAGAAVGGQAPARPIGVQPSLLQSSHPAQPNVAAPQRPPNEPPVQRGRDAVLFAAVETMDL